MPRLSMRSISRPALAKPTRSLRCSIDVEPNCVVTTSSTAWQQQVEVVADVVVDLALGRGRRGDVLAVGRLELVLAVLDDLARSRPR